MRDTEHGATSYFGIIAQLGEHLPYKQGVTGSIPVGPTHRTQKSSICLKEMERQFYMDGFPSGQRGQTVNLLSTTSKVRILLHPFLFKI